MPDGYEVLTGELTTHAGKVDALTDRLRTAVAAAGQVTMGDEAFGVICQPFALLLRPFEELGVRALGTGADALDDTAGRVRDSAASYDADDTAEANEFRGIEGTL